MEIVITETINKQRLLADAIYKMLREDLSYTGAEKTELFKAIYSEVNKDLRMDRISSERNGKSVQSAQEPATIKQRELLAKLGIKTENLTKAQAIDVIKEALERGQ